MAFSNLNDLLIFLNQYFKDETFSLPTGVIGSESIDVQIQHYLSSDGKTLQLIYASPPEITGNAVQTQGYISNLLGFSPCFITLQFDLADHGNPSLLAGVSPLDTRQKPPISNWNLGLAFPVWAKVNAPLTQLVFNSPVFYISSIARPEESGRPAVSETLNFTALGIEFTGILSLLKVLPAEVQFKNFTGVISGLPNAPVLQLLSDPIQAIPIEYLNIPLQFGAVSELPSPAILELTNNPPPVKTYLEIASSIPIGKVASIPIVAKFNALGMVLVLESDLTQLDQYLVSEFSSFTDNTDFQSVLKGFVDIGETVTLKKLSVYIGLKPFDLSAVSLSLGTSKSLTIIDHYVTIPKLDVAFMINDPMGTKDISATLTGTFQFLEDIDVSISASYPSFVFSGGLDSNSKLTLANIFNKFLPSVTYVPDVTISNLWVAACLKSPQWFNFKVGISSEWKIPIGIAQFQLTEADLNLAYAVGNSGFSGEISAVATLFNQSNEEIAIFTMDWNLPGTFMLKGAFPEINLSSLANALIGNYLPNVNGFPEIQLLNSQIELTISKETLPVYGIWRNTASTGFDLVLNTTVNADKIGQAGIYFEVKKQTGSPGFTAGLVVAPDWKPDSIWSGLSDVFSVLKVIDGGLILSSIPVQSFNPPGFNNFPYVPNQIQPGITFFSTLEIDGTKLDILKSLFNDTIQFNLYAFIDNSQLSNSEIKALLPGSQGKGIVTFNGLTIDMKPGKGEFDILASAILRLDNEQLTLTGGGSINLSAGSATFILDIHCWEHPFGIQGLTILDFGINFGLSEPGAQLGLLGSFLIGNPAEGQFKFTVGGDILDFELPDAFIFGLDDTNPNKPLQLTDLIKEFTSLDLSKVPLLNSIAFKNIDFYVVDNPSGWTAPNGYHYKPGIGIDADLFVYSYEAKLNLEINWSTGIVASGSINQPINLFDVFILSDATGKTGPNASIDTTNITRPELYELSPKFSDDCVNTYMTRIIHPRRFSYPPSARPAVYGILPITIMTKGDQANTYFSFSGGLKLLGAQVSFSGAAEQTGFEVNFNLDLGKHLFRAAFYSAYSKANGFKGSTKGNFDFQLDFPNGLIIDGIPILPPFTVYGPNANLDLECVINPNALADAYVKFDLEFHWGTFHFHPQFTLSPQVIVNMFEDLWQHIADWIKNNLKTFFSDLLSDAAKFIEAVASGVLALGQSAIELATVLFEWFKASVEDCAKYLYETLKLGLESVVAALIAVYNITKEDALRILNAIGQVCALETANIIIFQNNLNQIS